MSRLRRRLMGISRDAGWEKVETYVHSSNIVLQPVSLDYDTASFGFEVAQGSLDDAYVSIQKKSMAILVPNAGCMPQNMPGELVKNGDVWIDKCRVDGSSLVIDGYWGINSISREDNPNLDLSRFRFELLSIGGKDERNSFSQEWEHPLDLENYDYREVFSMGFWGGCILSLIGNFSYENSVWGIRTLYPSVLCRDISYGGSSLSFHDRFSLNTADFDGNDIMETAREDSYGASFDLSSGDILKSRWGRTNMANGQYIELYRRPKN